MSRIGKKPIEVPAGVSVELTDRTIKVKGPKNEELKFTHRPEITVEIADDGKTVTVSRGDDERESRSFHGLTRAIIQNMVVGVTQGYTKKLEISGVGYLAAIQNNVLQLRVGFANEIQKPIPAGLTVTCPDQTHIVIQGPDKQQVGQFAAEVRACRKPEPYKGKGIKYEGEQIRRKAGKANVK